MMMERGRDVHMYGLRSVVYLSGLGRLLGYAHVLQLVCTRQGKRL